MPLLRKTGVRSPWMPAPLDAGVIASADVLRQTIVIGAIVPALLLGGNVEVVGQLPRPENVQWPARPAVVVQQPVPVPGANVEQTYAPRDLGVVVQVDHTWPVAPIVGQQPIPPASFWAPTLARLPNADPLRPPIVVADPPDPTLAQPSTAWIGRLSRAEDTSRPARPALVQVGQQPLPGAQAFSIGVVHDAPVVAPDRLSSTGVILGAVPVPGALAQLVGAGKAAPTDRLALTIALVGMQPVPQARALPIGIVHDAPAAPSDRLPPGTAVQLGYQPVAGASAQLVGRPAPPEDVQWTARPTVVQTGAQPVPSARVQPITALRDQVVVAIDRLAFTQVVSGQQPQPTGRAQFVGIVHADDRALVRTAVQVGQQPQPGALSVRVGAALPAPTDRPAVTRLYVGAQPVPGASVRWGRAGLSDFIPDPDIQGPTTAALAASGVMPAGLASDGSTSAALSSSGATTAFLASDGHTTAELMDDGRTTAEL